MLEDDDVQPDSLFASVDGMRVHYKRSGQGASLVLLHGSASSLWGVEDVARRLEPFFDVIRPDLPGHGVTGPRSGGDYRVRTYAGTVDRFLGAIGVDSAVIVGNSLDGNIAWNLAVIRPERVVALVLINATGYPEKELPASMRLARNPIAGYVLRRFMPRRAVERSLRQAAAPNVEVITEAVVDRAHRLWNRPGNRAAFVDLVCTDQPDHSAEICSIAAPTLMLRSAGMGGQYFTRDIPGAIEEVHPRGGHLLPQEDPDWVAAAITRFVSTRVGGIR
ncbi:alpha/beta hydrolase [Mycolicibacterium canariasense]|uniref:Alpha/beta hydrolase n=1 Tax=Mycolicibacterium canariasense TaxID=228230 RepID=A0A100WKE0_MYCCR|nr:alpha/beta hydrolase [Mycolicibacterium canariasense]ORV08945.1 alpha/beta hydrolase [Mycolicibacterium canariasense]GAS99861.1 alpha/beta hydrolase [Mycolicibacterium canariasense]